MNSLEHSKFCKTDMVQLSNGSTGQPATVRKTNPKSLSHYARWLYRSSKEKQSLETRQ